MATDRLHSLEKAPENRHPPEKANPALLALRERLFLSSLHADGDAPPPQLINAPLCAGRFPPACEMPLQRERPHAPSPSPAGRLDAAGARAGDVAPCGAAPGPAPSVPSRQPAPQGPVRHLQGLGLAPALTLCPGAAWLGP